MQRRDARRLIPRDRAPQTFLESRMRTEAEALLGSSRVEVASRLSVRLRRIPRNPAGEAHDARDHFGERLDRELAARSDVHRIAAVVAFAREQDRLGRVLDIQELPRRRSVSPHLDLPGATIDGIDAL